MRPLALFGRSLSSLALAGGLGGGPTPAEYRARADELQAYLDRHVLAVRFPKAVDREHGGFHVSYRRDWTPLPDQDRFVVFQARLTWTAARVAIERPERRDEYLGYVRHGVACLRDAYWDREHGGFRSYVRIAGTGEAPESGLKQAYGNAFAVYALAAAYEATSDPKDLEVHEDIFITGGIPLGRLALLARSLPFWQQVIKGFVILTAVAVDRLSAKTD